MCAKFQGTAYIYPAVPESGSVIITTKTCKLLSPVDARLQAKFSGPESIYLNFVHIVYSMVKFNWLTLQTWEGRLHKGRREGMCKGRSRARFKISWCCCKTWSRRYWRDPSIIHPCGSPEISTFMLVTPFNHLSVNNLPQIHLKNLRVWGQRNCRSYGKSRNAMLNDRSSCWTWLVSR